ncbi:hypothetical protein ABZW32_12010 [Streptomyces sp. NPDC004667]|uniref:hypothetical protein n=1 Tax=Streptomyces sp. NPDC004667 TaxID=3154285 RepID=UPI00339EF92B
MATSDDTSDFTALSARLTGFDEEELRATGLCDAYRRVASEQLGTGRFERLLRGAARPGGGTDGGLPDAARAVTLLWYTGSWPGPPPFVVSPLAYAQGLAWKAAGLMAPATEPAGYGSWALPPAEVDGP